MGDHNRNSANHPCIALLAIAGIFTSSSALAAGFEKSLTWSAKAAAQAGAVTASTDGAEALFFNPAGLAETGGTEVSLNFSPTFSKFSGANPFQNAGSVDGENGFSPVGGVLLSHRVTPQLGVGVGFYVSGGTKAQFEDLNYTGAGAGYTFRPTVETDLAVTEAALGAGYEIIPGLRIGAAWRVVMVSADFSTVSGNPAAFLQNTSVNDISKTRWNGWKLGMQYEASDKSWGVGTSYRSQTSFNAKGTATAVRNTTGGTITNLSLGDTWISNVFPHQISLGAFFKLSDLWKVSPEYSFTNYSENKFLGISGGVASTIAQNWKNQHIGRLGFEYLGMGIPLRFGYAYTSQVTPSDHARSSFASPGSGHAIAAGSGMSLGTIDFDFAGEYSFASGSGTNGSEVATSTDFKSHAYVVHLSGKMHF